MDEVAAALIGAVIGGIMAFVIANRQTTTMLRAEAELRHEERAASELDRRQNAARVAATAIAQFLVSPGSDAAMESAMQQVRLTALGEAAVLPSTLFGYMWELASIIDHYVWGGADDATKDVRAYAEFVHRSLIHYSAHANVVEGVLPPELDGKWTAPESSLYVDD